MIDTLKKDIRLYNAFCFFIGFYVANGTAVLFARELGLTYSHIFILTGVYMLMFILLEVPTGAVADLIGRKKTMMIGCFLLTGAAIASGASNNFWQLFASYFLWACGFSLISGSGEALLYDRVADDQKFSQLIGKAGFYSIIGTALAGIAGPYLFNINFRWAYFGSAIPFFIAGLAINFFHEQFTAKGFTIKNQINQIKTGFQIGWQNKYILWSTGVLALGFAVSYTFSNIYQPYLLGIGFPVKMFSAILPAMFIVQAAGSMSFGKLLRFRENRLFMIGILGIAIIIALLGLINIQIALIFVLAYMFLEGVNRPLVSAYANRHLDSGTRATVISVQSMIGTILAAVMLFITGFLTDRIGINNVLLVLSGFVALIGITLLVSKPKNEIG